MSAFVHDLFQADEETSIYAFKANDKHQFFKMLIAPSAANHDITTPSALKTKSKKKLQHHQLRTHHNKEQQQQQKQQQEQKQEQQTNSETASKVKLNQQEANNNHVLNSSHIEEPKKQHQQHQQHQQQQKLTMDAMKSLDAKLVAYLTGEQLTAGTCIDSVVESQAMSKKNELNCSSSSGSMSSELFADDMNMLDDNSREMLYEMFKRMSGIKLQMEALTLQPEGTKRMELLQNDIRPIFTVECQLSHELIKSVPRSDLFHVMQFESEKFHSLTQCTRFAQEAERVVKLELTETVQFNKTTDGNGNNNIINNNNKFDNIDLMNNNNIVNDCEKVMKPNFGRIHFTVWWREPGTCLNEMLGMGVLALEELYAASVLEQCKRIVIHSRKEHLANLYFKISVQIAKEEINCIEIERIEQRSTSLLCTNTKVGSDENDNKKPPKVVTSDDTTAIQSSIGVVNSSSITETEGQSHDNVSNKGKDFNEKAAQIETTNFMSETSRVRLLRGIIFAGEVRHFDLQKDRDYLVCRRFWEDEFAVISADTDNKFNYQEQFAVINDEAFLQRVDRQHLQLELWQRQLTDGNGNSAQALAQGIVRLPLHQFFIAYRDATITNHLCKGKLPVISFDAWAPIISCTENGAHIGELRCMLAIGSDEQITKLKESHEFTIKTNDETALPNINRTLFKKQAIVPKELGNVTSGINVASAFQPTQLQSTSNLLDRLQRSLQNTRPEQPQQRAQPCGEPSPPRMPPELAPATSTAMAAGAATTTSTLLQPLQAVNVKLFHFLLEIESANGLPRNPGNVGRGKKKRNNANKQQRFPPNEAPSTYVTFQADEGQGPVYKSHEGAVFATNVVEKSTQPQWQKSFRLAASVDYLLNPEKRFILKIWKKAATDSPQKRQQPTPLDDAIVGFAALDLGVFLRGLYIGGTFNIVDFNGRINGQLEIRAQPLEDLHKLFNANRTATAIKQPPTPQTSISTSTGTHNFIDDFENALGLAHLNLGQAIKRKFTELEGISQRLRTRLVDVTGEQLAPQFNVSVLDKWQANQDCDRFDEFDEFERDINTKPATDTTANNDAVENNAKSNNDPHCDGNGDCDVVGDDIASKSVAPKE